MLALFQVILRVGWIFKTESVVMPAVLDYLGGGGMIRGWLPLINRLCQSVPTMVLAQRIRQTPYKKRGLAGSVLMMGACFAGLCFCFCFFEQHNIWLQLVFLGFYALFFVATGMNQVLFSTLQGKLVPANRRGRLLLVANLIGVGAAVGAVWGLMPRWVTAEGAEFQWLFATSAVAFVVAGLLTLAIDETRDDAPAPTTLGVKARFADAMAPLRSDSNFRKLSLVAALFGASIILFPHYQALGRNEHLGGNFRSLLLWLTVQNIGTAVFSIIVGPLADRRGNLAALRLALAGVALAPIVAMLLNWSQIVWAFPVVFVLVGLTPVVIRLLMNYTLEVAHAHEHPSYLAALSLVTGAPVILSPLAGLLVDLVGFAPVFVVISFCGVIGWGVSASLIEPRHRDGDSIANEKTA